jgi:DNA-binding CsgD family transcriptional regulator
MSWLAPGSAPAPDTGSWSADGQPGPTGWQSSSKAARPAELAAAIADAYGFTGRERAITALVARGLTTTEIADRLHLSAYTVQDHLKAIFVKSGTSSRGQLVSRLFFDHHVARLQSITAEHP